MTTEYDGRVLAQSPLAYYPFDETAGSIANDLSGNGYHASYLNISLNATPGPDSAPTPLFDGTSSYVDFPASLESAFNVNTYTFSAWFYIPTSATWTDGVTRRLLTVFNSGANHTALIEKHLTSILRARIVNPGTSNINYTSQPIVWTHVAIRFNGGVLDLFIDGSLVGTVTGVPAFASPASAIYIGTNNVVSGNFWFGYIAKAAFWNVALADFVIRDLAQAVESPDNPILSAIGNNGVQYQVMVLDPVFGTVQGVFDAATFYELRYSRKLNDIGVIAFTIPSTDENRAKFQLDSFIEVYRTDPTGQTRAMQLEETYLARLFHRFREGDDEKYLIGGFSLNHLLKRRLIDPDEDPSSTGTGYSTKSGAADVIIQQYVYQQMGVGASVDRRVQNFSFGTIGGIGLPISRSLRYTELFEEVYDMALAGRVDFIIQRISNNALVMFIEQIGSDKSLSNNYPVRPWVGLSPIRGNLANPSFLVDRQDERTFIYALGQGQADSRLLYTQSAAGYSDSPYNRWEHYLDGRSNEKGDIVGLTNDAVAELFKYQARKTFEYTLEGGEGGNTYRVDWDVGDIVTALWDEIQYDLRVWGVDVQVNNQGELITIDTKSPMLNL